MDGGGGVGTIAIKWTQLMNYSHCKTSLRSIITKSKIGICGKVRDITKIIEVEGGGVGAYSSKVDTSQELWLL